MPRSVVAPLLPLWSAAVTGCMAFLLVDLLPSASISAALVVELAWLALIGSIPTALILGSALGAAGSSRVVIGAFAIAVAILVFAVGWEHTDFLTSGPRWALHPQRVWLRIAMAASFGALGAGGWRWLVAGAQAKGRSKLLLWTFLSLSAVASLVAATTRYRAYDYSLAQAVFPGGVLAAGVVYLHCRQAERCRLAVLALALVTTLVGAGSRLSPEWMATGEREVIAHSRAGSLVALYVLPHLGADRGWESGDIDCSLPRPVVEQAPLVIPQAQRRNVIVITVDALRKDVVGAREDGAAVTPELSRISARGISFENATTTYPATLFAVGSAFTGLSPAELYLSPGMPETIFTLSRAHVDQQLVILPDVSWFRLPIVREFLAPGVESSFAPTDGAATRTLIDRLNTAKADGDSVMAWIHYYSPHDPYQSHPSHRFGRGRRNAYLSEVAYFDQQIGELMGYLEGAGWLDDTLVVFFSDHGEALGERAYFGHHVYLDGWMIDVPLILWHASFEPSRPRVGASVTDVAPTVLHFLGLPQPANLPSQSLFTLDPDDADRPTFSEAFPVRGRELFDSFRLPALDDATIRNRLRAIRVASKGYEPKGAITKGRRRLIHHRGLDATLVYDRRPDGTESELSRSNERDPAEPLRTELERWEREQLRRIECRLRLTASR